MSSAGKASKGRRSTEPSVRKLQRELTSVYSDLCESRVQHHATKGTLAELERKYARLAELERKYARLEQQLASSAAQNADQLRAIVQRDGWMARQRELDAHRIREIKARFGGCDGE